MSEIAEERARIARELHDGIAQDLAALGYALDAEIGRSDTHPQSRSALRGIRGEVTKLNSKVRDEIFRLRQRTSIPLVDSLISSGESLGMRVDISGELPEGDVGIELQKVILELMRNAAEHGRSSTASISIGSDEINVEFNSTDESDSGTENREKSFGLIGIRERLNACGWLIDISPDFTTALIRRG